MNKFRRGDKVELIEKYKGYEYKAFDGKYFIVIEAYDHGSITCIDCTHNLHFVRPSEITILEKQPVYYTVPSPEQVDKIDYKKAFEMLFSAMNDKGKIVCSLCPARNNCGANAPDNESCHEAIEKEILKQCTEGGE